MPSCSQCATTPSVSASRKKGFSRFCTVTTSTCRRAALIWSTETFESPTHRILPARWSSASIPTLSPNGTCGSGAWNW